jgi:hypothetical protein
MNITSEEAISLLEEWRTAGTPLRVHLSGKEFQAAIDAITGTQISLISGREKVQIDVQGADFNGDSRKVSGYLVCEFRDGDRCSFYVLAQPL